MWVNFVSGLPTIHGPIAVRDAKTILARWWGNAAALPIISAPTSVSAVGAAPGKDAGGM